MCLSTSVRGAVVPRLAFLYLAMSYILCTDPKVAQQKLDKLPKSLDLGIVVLDSGIGDAAEKTRPTHANVEHITSNMKVWLKRRSMFHFLF